MEKGFALWLVLGALFALWLFNTGRVASFKAWLQTTPAQPTLPTGAKQVGSSSGSGVNAQKTAACSAQASAGIVTADCLNTFLQDINRPGDLISSAVSTLSLGIIKL